MSYNKNARNLLEALAIVRADGIAVVELGDTQKTIAFDMIAADAAWVDSYGRCLKLTAETIGVLGLVWRGNEKEARRPYYASVLSYLQQIGSIIPYGKNGLWLEGNLLGILADEK